MVGIIGSSPQVEIGLTDRPKSGGARAPPAPPLATGLQFYLKSKKKFPDGSDGTSLRHW